MHVDKHVIKKLLQLLETVDNDNELICIHHTLSTYMKHWIYQENGDLKFKARNAN